MTEQEIRTTGSGNGEGAAKSFIRRSRLEIQMDILRTLLEGGRGPTQIMYRANLSWPLISEDLMNLLNLGLVDEQFVGKRKMYSLTERGLRVVRSYLEVLEEIQTPLDIVNPHLAAWSSLSRRQAWPDPAP